MKTTIIKTAILGLCVLALAVQAAAGQKRSERWYQERWCEGKGQMEVVMPDGTRCDCLTDSHAIEFDFGKKWSEAMGQSLNYAMQTNKRAGIVMIIESPKDRKYWIRLNSIIQHYGLPIDTWVMED